MCSPSLRRPNERYSGLALSTATGDNVLSNTVAENTQSVRTQRSQRESEPEPKKFRVWFFFFSSQSNLVTLNFVCLLVLWQCVPHSPVATCFKGASFS